MSLDPSSNTRIVQIGTVALRRGKTLAMNPVFGMSSFASVRLRERKIANIVQTSPALVATGNIGRIAQIASGTAIPVLHTIELLDFAHGGPTPDGLASLAG